MSDLDPTGYTLEEWKRIRGTRTGTMTLNGVTYTDLNEVEWRQANPGATPPPTIDAATAANRRTRSTEQGLAVILDADPVETFDDMVRPLLIEAHGEEEVARMEAEWEATMAKAQATPATRSQVAAMLARGETVAVHLVAESGEHDG